MKVLVVAPHADDETIGMGGTIARYTSEGHKVTVAVMTGHGDEAPHPLWPREAWDTIRSEMRAAAKILGVADVIFEEIPAVMVADEPMWKLNLITQRVITATKPDILYVPFLFDLHKDHREIFHSFSVHWRPFLPLGYQIKEVYTYEVMSETHLNFPYVEQGFIPNAWVDISHYLDIKLDALSCYKSQLQEAPYPRSIEAIKSLAIWRGSLIGVKAAEAFVLVRRIY